MSGQPHYPAPQQPTPPGRNGASAPTPPKPSRKGLWITLSIVGVVAVAGLVIGVVFAVRALTGGPTPQAASTDDVASSPSQESQGSPGSQKESAPAPEETTLAPAPAQTPAPSAPASSGPNLSGAFKERDQFFQDQRLPMDGSPLKAVTPKQKEFIARMDSEYTKLGATWSDQDESIALALTSDACETSILNSHNLDETSVRTHVSTSPLIGSLVGQAAPEQKGQATNGLAKTLVIGTEYMCPADHPQWQAAFDSVNGNW